MNTRDGNAREREEQLTLQVLEAIEARSDVTQRHLAGRMGVALGLANSYLKRCVRKGLVKIQQAPANRYLYYLTPHGFAEKSRLTAQYLSYSFEFYRTAAGACEQVLDACQDAGLRRVGLYGVSELAEIAALQAMKRGVELACICDASFEPATFLKIPRIRTPEQAPVDAWVVTDLKDPAAARRRLTAVAGKERVFVPAVLGLEASRSDARHGPPGGSLDVPAGESDASGTSRTAL